MQPREGGDDGKDSEERRQKRKGRGRRRRRSRGSIWCERCTGMSDEAVPESGRRRRARGGGGGTCRRKRPAKLSGGTYTRLSEGSLHQPATGVPAAEEQWMERRAMQRGRQGAKVDGRGGAGGRSRVAAIPSPPLPSSRAEAVVGEGESVCDGAAVFAHHDVSSDPRPTCPIAEVTDVPPAALAGQEQPSQCCATAATTVALLGGAFQRSHGGSHPSAGGPTAAQQPTADRFASGRRRAAEGRLGSSVWPGQPFPAALSNLCRTSPEASLRSTVPRSPRRQGFQGRPSS